MKFSKFNNFIPYKNKVLYNNSFTKQTLILDSLLMDLIISAEKNNEIDDLKKIHPELYNTLLHGEFLVDNNLDEISRVKDLINTVDGNTETFYLIINPTMNCNFKCWYCYETHIKGSKMDDVNIANILSFINNCFKENRNLKTFIISFFGGEPLLYFYQVILPIITKSNEIVNNYNAELKIGFTTNAYLIDEKILQNLKPFTVMGLQITLDGYKEFHDNTRFISNNKGSYVEIIDNIKKVVKNGINVTLRINYNSKNISSLHQILLDFSDLDNECRKRIFLSMNKVWQDEEITIWDERVTEFSNLANKFGFITKSPLFQDGVRGSCYADKRNQATINYNGDVYKCNARDFKTENREGYLDNSGQINWNNDIELRYDIKLKNKPCLECSILPICGGGCSQKAIEYYKLGKEYCVNDFDENKKKEIILNMFLSENVNED